MVVAWPLQAPVVQRHILVALPYSDVPFPGAWFRRGRCRGEGLTDLFFSKNKRKVAQAKAVCAQCVVRMECQEYIRRYPHLHGVWAGTSSLERVRWIGDPSLPLAGLG